MESLYERLGGTDRITAIAGDLFELHLANPRISPRYAESDPAQVKNAVATYFIGVTGGPDDYEGKDMLPAHRGMNIGAAQFMAALDDVLEALDKNGVDQLDHASTKFRRVRRATLRHRGFSSPKW